MYDICIESSNQKNNMAIPEIITQNCFIMLQFFFKLSKHLCAEH